MVLVGGIRSAEAEVSGPGTFRSLTFEGGIHRVQRTPKTEKAGRIHTSTASVVILPKPSDVSRAVRVTSFLSVNFRSLSEVLRFMNVNS